MKKLALLSAVVLGLSGCATQGPVAEVRLVSQAFENLSGASQPLLDELALAERAQGRRVALARAGANEARAPGAPVDTANAKICPGILLIALPESAGVPPVQNDFCPEDSPYWSELDDPPGTRAFRRALAAVGDYTTLLMMLAENRNIDEAMGQLQVLAGNLGTALAMVGGGGVDATLGTALEAFKPLLQIAAQRANSEELKRLVKQESPKVDKLVEALRASARPMFRTLTGQSRRLLTRDGADPAQIKAEAARVEGYRVAISNYVMLLDQYGRLLGDLVAAYEQPHPGSLASLAQRSARLSAQAEAWRRSLAALRSGLQ